MAFAAPGSITKSTDSSPADPSTPTTMAQAGANSTTEAQSGVTAAPPATDGPTGAYASGSPAQPQAAQQAPAAPAQTSPVSQPAAPGVLPNGNGGAAPVWHGISQFLAAQNPGQVGALQSNYANTINDATGAAQSAIAGGLQHATGASQAGTNLGSFSAANPGDISGVNLAGYTGPSVTAAGADVAGAGGAVGHATDLANAAASGTMAPDAYTNALLHQGGNWDQIQSAIGGAQGLKSQLGNAENTAAANAIAAGDASAANVATQKANMGQAGMKLIDAANQAGKDAKASQAAEQAALDHLYSGDINQVSQDDLKTLGLTADQLRTLQSQMQTTGAETNQQASDTANRIGQLNNAVNGLRASGSYGSGTGQQSAIRQIIQQAFPGASPDLVQQMTAAAFQGQDLSQFGNQLGTNAKNAWQDATPDQWAQLLDSSGYSRAANAAGGQYYTAEQAAQQNALNQLLGNNGTVSSGSYDSGVNNAAAATKAQQVAQQNGAVQQEHQNQLQQYVQTHSNDAALGAKGVTWDSPEFQAWLKAQG